MINTQSVAEDSLQTLCELSGENNLREHKEHLMPTFQFLLDKVYVHLRLSTAGYPMEQTDVLFFPHRLYLMHCLLLGLAQGMHDQMGGNLLFGESAHRLLPHLQHSLLSERVERRRTEASVEKKFLTGHILEQSVVMQYLSR